MSEKLEIQQQISAVIRYVSAQVGGREALAKKLSYIPIANLTDDELTLARKIASVQYRLAQYDAAIRYGLEGLTTSPEIEHWYNVAHNIGVEYRQRSRRRRMAARERRR